MTTFTTTGRKLAAAMSEDDLLRSCLDLAAALGLLAHHCRPARTERGWVTPISGDKGFPDLVLVGRRGVLHRELKSAKGKPSPEQAVWLSRLSEAGADAGVWKPADWPRTIKAEMEAIR